jgi:hypothetical protein
MAYAFGAPSIVQDGLVFYVDPANKDSYPGSGTIATCLISGVTGSLINNPSVEPNNAGVWDFDGVNDVVQFNNSTAVNALTKPAGSFTIGGWFQGGRTSNANAEGFGNTGYSGNRGINFGLYPNAAGSSPDTISTLFQIPASSTSTRYLTSVNAFSYPVPFIYLVGVYDSVNQKMGIYVNGSTSNPGGVALTTSATGGSIPSSAFNGGTSPTQIGGRGDGANYIDQIGPIHMYHRVLSPEEIMQNYNALKGRFI